MLTAEKTSVWRGRYQISSDGLPITVWDPSWWRTGGEFEVDGHRFTVRANGWGSKYRMLDQAENEIALVERAGRKHWTVRADSHTYEFRRASIWGTEQEMVRDGLRVGSVRRVSAWSGNIEADLPGMPVPIQIFVVGVQISLWQAQSAAAAS